MTAAFSKPLSSTLTLFPLPPLEGEGALTRAFCVESLATHWGERAGGGGKFAGLVQALERRVSLGHAARRSIILIAGIALATNAGSGACR